MATHSTDNIQARNSTKVYIKINGARVGRVQSLQQSITNNVQVLNELGRAFAVELKKGITQYSFSIAKFYARNDAFEAMPDIDAQRAEYAARLSARSERVFD